MRPLLKPGDGVIVDETVPFESLRKGDVVCFQPPGMPYRVVHRVVGITPRGLITRGDNNPENDPLRVVPDFDPVRVTGVRRGRKTIRMHGGPRGMLLHRMYRVRRTFLRWTTMPLKKVLDFVADAGILRCPKLLRKRIAVYAYGRGDGEYLVLFCGKRKIGEKNGDGAWRIKQPWRLFIKEGRIVETGTREKPMNLDGEYARMYEARARGSRRGPEGRRSRNPAGAKRTNSGGEVP